MFALREHLKSVLPLNSIALSGCSHFASVESMHLSLECCNPFLLCYRHRLLGCKQHVKGVTTILDLLTIDVGGQEAPVLVPLIGATQLVGNVSPPVSILSNYTKLILA